MLDMQTLFKTALEEIGKVLADIDDEEILALRRAMSNADHIFVIGRGRSGFQMRGFAMRLMQLGFQVHVVGEATTPAIRAGDLLIIGSASGRTVPVGAYAEAARRAGAEVALITVDKTSPVAKHANLIVNIAASSPKLGDMQMSLFPLGDIFERALGMLLDAVIVQLMEELDVTAEEMYSRHANLE